MALDMDNLTPAVDIDTLDLSNADRGDTLDALEEALQDDPTPPAEDPPKAEDPPPAEDPPAEDPPAEDDEQPRDEKGRFDKKEARIPKSRFDEQVGKEREAREAAERRAEEAERRLNEQLAQQKQSADIEAMEAKVSEMEKEYNRLLLDGEADKAAEIMSHIRKAERQIVSIETEQRTAQRTTQILESERVALAVAQAESAYPQLNPESSEFDEQIVNFVLAEQQRLIKTQGFTPSVALKRAADGVMERFVPVEKPAAEDPKGLGKAAAADRKAEAVSRNVAASKAQPPSLTVAGMDSDKAGATSLPDPTKMSQEEFAALPESVKARMRGDDL